LLADCLQSQRKYSQAEPLYREILQSKRQRLSAEEEEAIGAAVDLAHLLSEWAWTERPSAGEPAVNSGAPAEYARESERLLRGCLAARESHANPSRGLVGDTRSRLGGAVLALAVNDSTLGTNARHIRFTEAEQFLRSGYELMARSTSATSKHKRDGLDRLVRLYEAWDAVAPGNGQAAQAAQWKQALAAFQETAAQRQPKPSDAGADTQPAKE
jgi:hypothetical protein